MQEQHNKNRKLAEKRGREALLKIKQRNEKKKCMTKSKKAVTVATQVSSPIAITIQNKKRQEPNIHVGVEELNESMSESTTSIIIPYSQRIHEQNNQNYNLNNKSYSNIDHSTESLSSSIEIITKGSSLSKTLPLAISKEIFVNPETAASSGNNINNILIQTQSARTTAENGYNPLDFIAETSSESNSIQDPVSNSPVFTKVSDLINKRRMSRTENYARSIEPGTHPANDNIHKTLEENKKSSPRKNSQQSTQKYTQQFIQKSVTSQPPATSPQKSSGSSFNTVSIPSKSTTNVQLKSCLRSSSSLIAKKPASAKTKPKTPLKGITKITTPKRKLIRSLKTKSPAKMSVVNSPSLSKKQFVPIFVKPTSSTKLFVEGQSIQNKMHSVWPIPKESAASSQHASTSLNDQRVQFYDHTNRFSKEYIQPENIVQRISSTDDQPTAMTAAREEIQLDAERAKQLEELK